MAEGRHEQYNAFVALDDPYDDAPIGYFTTDPDGLIQRVNRTFLEWTGYATEDLIGKLCFADFLTGGGRVFMETHFAPSLHLHGRIEEVAFDFVCRDGSRFSALVNAVQRRDAGGVDLFRRITVFKATERRRYEQELLLARGEAERAANDLARTIAELSMANEALLRVNEELTGFAHAASHDLQAPLRTISMFSEVLQRRFGAELNPEAKVYLQNINEGTGAMQRLIRDLLALSQAGGAMNARQAVNLKDILEEVMTLLAADTAGTEAVIICDPMPTLAVDRRQILQLFQNLITNAIKYRHPERPPRITIAATMTDDTWRISVQDNGGGFAMDDAERIFAPFQRLYGAEVPGTGIGLALCRKVVESHGGKIWAESVIGEGSTFIFTLPLKDPR